MSDFTVLVDSSKTTQDSDNFEIQFSTPVKLNGIAHEVALKNLSTWFSWFNVSADYSNNQFKYSPNGGSNWYTVTIPSGNYSISQLETAIHDLMKANSHYTAGPPEVYNINFIPNYSTLKLYIELTGTYRIDFTVGNLYLLLGFSSAVLTASAYGSSNVNITNDVQSMLLRCSLVNGGAFDNGAGSDILYTFTPTVPAGASIVIDPVNPTYVAINSLDYITSVRIKLTDQRGRRINLNNEHLSCLLHIRPRRLFRK